MFFTILPANLVMAEENQEKQKQQVSSKVEEKVEKEEAFDKRSEKSKTFYNNNGTTTTEIHQSPIHYLDPISKKWKDIDNILVKKSMSDTYTNGGNVFQVGFTDTLTKEKPVMEMTEKDYSISLKPLSSNGKEPQTTEAKVKENKVTYVEAYENTDLVYSVGNEKVKEDIILKERPATDESISYTFAMDLKGLTHEVQEDGGILLKDKKSGDTIYYLEKPFMFDSVEPEGFTGFSESAVPEEALSYEVEMKTEKKGNQLLISIIPSKDWLLDDSRAYPVTIDPTIVKYQPVTELVDTNIRSALPTQTGGSDLELGAGLYKNSTTNNVIRSLLNFDVSDIPAGVRVIDAQLNLWASSVWNDTSVRLDLHPATSAWEENAATWTKRTASASWTISGGDYGSPHYSSQTVGALGSTLDSNHYKWSIAPSNLEKTINSGSPNLGFLLKSASETTAAYKKFYSGDNLDYAGYSPLLAITYVTNSRLGLEDYWTYDGQELTDGTAYVNLGTGNGILQFSDFEISSRGQSGISFERTYNTKASETNSFGPGWSFTGSETITEQTADKNITYTDRDGTVHPFLYNSFSNSYSTPTGIYLTLTKDAIDGYKLTDKFGNVSYFKKIIQDAETSGYSIAKLEYEKDRNGNTTSYAYNSKGNITGITDASGKTMSINYGSSGISNITFSGKKRTYHYTYEGQLKEVRDFKDTTSYVSIFFSYDSNGKLEKITDAKNNVTQINYTNGFVDSIQQSSNTDESIPITNYSYNIADYTSTVTDPEGGITKYNMNDNYVILKVTNQLEKTFSYDSMDSNYNPKQVTDAEGLTTKNLFDSKGNLLEETDPKGFTTHYTYDEYSNIKTVTDLKGTTEYFYDLKGNLIKIIDPEQRITEYGYDSYGNQISTKSPDGTEVSYSYDNLNNFVNTETDPLDRTIQTTTDAFGNILSIKDPKGISTLFSYDLRYLLTNVTDVEGNIASYSYDENSNLISATNFMGYTSSYTYDSQDQLSSRTEPMGETTVLGYDDNGNNTIIQKPSSVEIRKEYDKANQLLAVYADGVKKWSYTYDNNGKVKTTTNENTGLIKEFEYDLNENLIQEKAGSIYTNYEYNSVDEMVSLSGKSNNYAFSQSYILNDIGIIEGIKINGEQLVTLNYTKKGQPSLFTFVNGIESNYTYDSANQLTSFTVKNEDVLFLSETFEYDANGNITSISSNSENQFFSYDASNQLKNHTLPNGTEEAYDYDLAGNRIKKVEKENNQIRETLYSYNGNNQLTQIDGQMFSYDKDGNRIKDGQFLYEYDKLGNLVSIKSISGQEIAVYTYDEQRRRTSKTMNGQRINYHYGNGILVLFETDATGNIIAEYSYDQNGFPKTLTKNGQTYYYVLNGHNDVVALTDQLGQTVASYTYDAWGVILSQSGPMAEENPLRYASYRYDNETNLYYLIARYYNPKEGVFLSRDSQAGNLEDPKSQNGYNYASQNPLIYFDPDGNNPILFRLLGSVVLPILKNLAKRYGPSLLDEVAPYVKSIINPYLKKYSKDYIIEFAVGNTVLKIRKKSGKGDTRIFSFDYHKIAFFDRKGKQHKRDAWHYHRGNPDYHYVFRFNDEFSAGYSLPKSKYYKWVW